MGWGAAGSGHRPLARRRLVLGQATLKTSTANVECSAHVLFAGFLRTLFNSVTKAQDFSLADPLVSPSYVLPLLALGLPSGPPLVEVSL